MFFFIFVKNNFLLNKSINNFVTKKYSFFCFPKKCFHIKHEKDEIIINQKTFVKKREIKDGKILRKNLLRELSSDKIIFFMSIIGFLETFWLSLSKIKSSPIICETETCTNVLSSVFSELFGLPISLFGFLIYLFVFLEIEKKKISKIELFFFPKKKNFFFINNILLFFGIFSIYFSLILEKILKMKCQWCLLSILFTSTILINFSFKQNYNKPLTKLILLIMIVLVLFFYFTNFIEIFFSMNLF